MTRILVAMEREAEALGVPCEVIGIGATHLPETTEEDILVNVGYCGGYGIPVGTVVEPLFTENCQTGQVRDLEPHFPCESYPCITSDSFVIEPLYECPAIYDMELWQVSSLPHQKLYALKIVSDNLDEADCEAYNGEAAWERVRELLKGEKLI